MKPVKQRNKHNPDRGVFGDCHRAAIASILELDYDEVPHFADGGPDGEEFNRRVIEFLKVKKLTPVHVIYPGESLGGNLADILTCLKSHNPGVHFLLGGTSRTGVDHTVVCCDGAIVHDPSKNASGIVGPCDDGHYWVTYLAAILPAPKTADELLAGELFSDKPGVIEESITRQFNEKISVVEREVNRVVAACRRIVEAHGRYELSQMIETQYRRVVRQILKEQQAKNSVGFVAVEEAVRESVKSVPSVQDSAKVGQLVGNLLDGCSEYHMAKGGGQLLPAMIVDDPHKVKERLTEAQRSELISILKRKYREYPRLEPGEIVNSTGWATCIAIVKRIQDEQTKEMERTQPGEVKHSMLQYAESVLGVVADRIDKAKLVVPPVFIEFPILLEPANPDAIIPDDLGKNRRNVADDMRKTIDQAISQFPESARDEIGRIEKPVCPPCPTASLEPLLDKACELSREAAKRNDPEFEAKEEARRKEWEELNRFVCGTPEEVTEAERQARVKKLEEELKGYDPPNPNLPYP